MWHKITVEQYQQVALIHKERIDEVDKMLRIIGVLFNKTESEVEDLPVKTYQKYMAEVAAMFQHPPEGRYVDRIRIGRTRYRFSFTPGKLRYGQWVEVQHFLQAGIIENLHNIAASISSPLLLGLMPGKNRSETHSKRAEDFLQAGFMDTYSSVLFFCNAWNGLSGDIPDYSHLRTLRMIQKKRTQHPTLRETFTTALDGYTRRLRSGSMKALPSTPSTT